MFSPLEIRNQKIGKTGNGGGKNPKMLTFRVLDRKSVFF